jgi:hypothetical protein
VAWLREQNAKTPFHALGIASFGPVDLDRASPTYQHAHAAIPLRVSCSLSVFRVCRVVLLIVYACRYGYITTTPKPDWGNVDVLSRFSEFNVPTVFTPAHHPSSAPIIITTTTVFLLFHHFACRTTHDGLCAIRRSKRTSTRPP